MSVSIRGVARRFLNRTGTLSIRDDFFDGAEGSKTLRPRAESLARQEIHYRFAECIYGAIARYEQTWSHVYVRIELKPDAGIPDVTMATLQTTWENAIEDIWSNRWCIGRAGEIACPLTFDVEWVTHHPHHTVRVRVGSLPTNEALWDTEDGAGVVAHEFGHMLGHPDEYVDSNCPDRDPVNTETIMDRRGEDVPARLMQRLADNVGSNVVSCSSQAAFPP
jgi:hypothetical protein